jgi:hypothetical protein
MKLRKALPGLLSAAAFLFVQSKLNLLLAFGPGPVPPLVPDPAHRILIAVGVATLALFAASTPKAASASGRLWRAFFRALCWSLLLAGLLFEFSTILRFSTLPVPVGDLLRMAAGVFGFLLVTVFTALVTPDPSAPVHRS